MPARLLTPENTLWLLVAAIGLWLLLQLGPILSPFLMAAILAYVLNPSVTAMQRHGLGRTLGAVVMICVLLLVVLGLALVLVPLFVKEIRLLAERLPGYLDELNGHVAPWLAQRLGLAVSFDAASAKTLIAEALHGSQGLGMKLLDSLRIGSLSIVGFIANLLLVPVVLFYLLRDWQLLLQRLDRLVPRRWHQRLRGMSGEIDAVLAEFLRGQLAVILVMSTYYSLALWLTGLDFYLPIGILTGVLVFIPYAGMLTGLALGTLAALMQFGTDSGLYWVLSAFAIGQALEGMLVTPWLIGNRIGLHPVSVIFALLAFGQIFGFFGVLLALPASAALLVGLRHLRRHYLASTLYGDAS